MIRRRDLPWEYGPPGRPSNSVLRPLDRSTTHPKVNPRRPRRRPSTTKTSSSSPSLYLSKKSRKKDDRLNIAPWSTAHARPTPPSSIFHLDLISLFFFVVIIVNLSLSSTKKGPRCTRKRLCSLHARRYIRTKRIRSIRSTTLRSSRLSVHTHSSPFSLCRALLFYLQY